MNNWKLDIGATVIDKEKACFRVWAPKVDLLSVCVISQKGEKAIFTLEKDHRGYFSGTVNGVSGGDRYFYVLNNTIERPDPASRFQPEGVHGPSQVIDPGSFVWTDDAWKGVPLKNFIIYELHVGTFTEEGTFQSIIPYLDYLQELGITAIELMPVAQFPGNRNWGYDGAYPFAPQNSYGGPDGLKTLINACHKKGFAVILDVVYNHLGPEGNYLNCFGHYFTDRYKTPWGDAINYDGPYSDGVRKFFIDNSLYWIIEYHIDALRVDAVHGIFDFSAKHFLQELTETIHRHTIAPGRNVSVIAESDLNDVKVINSPENGGYGFDAQWNDDFHHAIHTLITGETKGYYEDFGKITHMEKAFREGFVYSGHYSGFRKRRHGSSSRDVAAHRFIVFSQNHDQVGNRMLGERLSNLVSFETLKLAAGAVLLSPFIPLLFMGEEYGEDAPFLYFVSHSDPALIEAVREGRKKEFDGFKWQGEPPDPQSAETFLKSKINWEKRNEGNHKVLIDFYKNVITIRKTIPALSHLDKNCLYVNGLENEKIVFMRRWKDFDHVFLIFNFNSADMKLVPSGIEGRWNKVLDSSEKVWNGPGALLPDELNSGKEIIIRGQSFVMYRKGKT
ncbi:MAG: malto-oligosyltrehalose trehalohydrolase [Candidatus Brocadia sp.]|jgi:maltooligosyltrehalose trehalohydrolase